MRGRANVEKRLLQKPLRLNIPEVEEGTRIVDFLMGKETLMHKLPLIVIPQLTIYPQWCKKVLLQTHVHNIIVACGGELYGTVNNSVDCTDCLRAL